MPRVDGSAVGSRAARAPAPRPALLTFWVLAWLRAFAVTVAIEAPVAAILLAHSERRLPRRLAGIILVNLATHPLVWFAFPGLSLPYQARAALSELWAVAIEAGGYAILWPDPSPGVAWRRGALVSLAANAASFAAGLLLQAL